MTLATSIFARKCGLVFLSWFCILATAHPTKGQSCRPLEQEILYEYDPSHQFYPDSSVVLSVESNGSGLSIDISTTVRSSGQGRVRFLESTDVGGHWSVLNRRDVATPLALAGSRFLEAPSDPRIQYKYSEKSGTYLRSSDAGKTWGVPANKFGGLGLEEFVRVSAGAQDYRARFSIAAVHPSKPLTIFSTVRLEHEGKNGTIRDSIYIGMYRSEDGAEHWSKVTDAVEYGTPIGIDPANPSVMFGYGKVGLVGMIKTSDAGNSWSLTRQQELMERRPKLVVEEHGSAILGAPVGIAVHQFAVDPGTPGTVYAVSTKGIYRSFDGGERWCLLKAEKDFVDSVYSLAFDPADSNKIFVGTRFGVLYSVDRGEHFERIYPSVHK